MQNNKEESKPDLFNDLSYICKTNKVILDALKKGSDVTQMPNGDIIVTEVKVVNTQYKWDKKKDKLIKITKI